jgi:hypothetical protein
LNTIHVTTTNTVGIQAKPSQAKPSQAKRCNDGYHESFLHGRDALGLHHMVNKRHEWRIDPDQVTQPFGGCCTFCCCNSSDTDTDKAASGSSSDLAQIRERISRDVMVGTSAIAKRNVTFEALKQVA